MRANERASAAGRSRRARRPAHAPRAPCCQPLARALPALSARRLSPPAAPLRDGGFPLPSLQPGVRSRRLGVSSHPAAAAAAARAPPAPPHSGKGMRELRANRGAGKRMPSPERAAPAGAPHPFPRAWRRRRDSGAARQPPPPGTGEGAAPRRAPLPARSSPAGRRRGLSRLRPAGSGVGRPGRRAAAAAPAEVAGPGRPRGAAGCPWRGRAPGCFAVPGTTAARGDAPPRAGR